MKILVAEDNKAAGDALRLFLERRGHAVELVADGRVAWERVQRKPHDLVLADVRMPELDGLELTRRIVAQHPDVLVVVMSSYASVDDAVEALKLGAFDYLTKPLDHERLTRFISRTSELVELRHEVGVLRERVGTPDRMGDLIGRDPAMFDVFTAIKRAAGSDRPVLITGDTGTGKTLVAQMIHKLSVRAAAPYIVVNCAAIPLGLFESEFFGHVRGAFTGALRARPGKLRAAHQGTVLLDEIGCLDVAAQAKLLQALETGQITPVGDDGALDVDVRLIAATNECLEEGVEAGSFRRDLYYRINVHRLHMPALRERRADIPLLARELVAQLAPERALAISPTVLSALTRHLWPGNVRELRNVLERMIAACDGQELLARHAPATIEQHAQNDQGWHGSLELLMDEFERALIREALERTDGQPVRCAELLGVSARTLERKLAKHRLRRRDRAAPDT